MTNFLFSLQHRSEYDLVLAISSYEQFILSFLLLQFETDFLADSFPVKKKSHPGNSLKLFCGKKQCKGFSWLLKNLSSFLSV